MKHEWHKIHGFMQGWGMREHIPDNEIVLQELSERCKVVKSKQQEKVIWLGDAHRYLKITSYDFFKLSSDELYELHEKLQPYLDAELERRRQLPPAKFEKISLPKINKPYPKLL
jgi:tRNA U34 5-methylaminomethyl-2-thiouridine-forming methyltransferase MnmC